MKRSLKANHYYFKEILAFLFLLLAVYFFRKQRAEIQQSEHVLTNADPIYIVLGLVFSILYISLFGFMYVYSFRAVNAKISLLDAVVLFLKRNFVSVFLPGGGVTSLAFFTSDLEKRGISKSKIGFASYIFGVVGIASLALISLPVLGFLAYSRGTSESSWIALSGLILLIITLIFATQSFLARGWVYKNLYKLSPQFEHIIEEINTGVFSRKNVMITLIFSLGVELCGIIHLYIAMKALGISAGLECCIAGYVIATLFFVISPFLRGLGAVEVSLIYVLGSYGMSNIDAISVTVLYRVFEFWLPLLAGIAAFGFSRGNILLRILPASLLAVLGVVNILSVLTPPLADRLHFLLEFLSLNTIHLSSIATLIAGILLLCCAAFLLRGLKNAWRLAVLLCLVSFIGHITKAIDFEEALIALLCLLVLIVTRKNYRVKSDPTVMGLGFQSSILILLSVLIYGVIGFYYLDPKDFGVDFSVIQSVTATIRSFVLLPADPVPLSRFGAGFILSINILGVLSIGLLLYAFVKPFIFKEVTLQEEVDKAKNLLSQFGRSSDDYYKTYQDKSFFFGQEIEGFISYKVANGFALALGEPVCGNPSTDMEPLLLAFEKFCLENSLKPAYYRIDSSVVDVFKRIGKKLIPIGQEAIVDLSSFSLEGKEKKSLRNALNALEKKGYKTVVYQPAIKDGLMQRLKLVSDDWLQSNDRTEILFSSGMFDWEELKEKVIITVENEEGKIVGFLNIIPDYAPKEGTYDLIRKTSDAPSGVMDALIVRLIAYLRENHIEQLNMGLAAMVGIVEVKTVPEWAMKFAYERLRQFKHYHGLFEFKDKYASRWEVKYLVYENDYDLLSLPLVLTKVMKEKES